MARPFAFLVALAAMQDDDKRLAAEAAIDEIRDGMLVGIGSGTTVAYAIGAIGRRLSEWPNAKFFSTSQSTTEAARAAGIPISRFAHEPAIDLAIDGVDEVDPQFRAIKGGGGAMLREKIVATAARRMVAIAHGAKQVTKLGRRARVPVEVLPFATAFVGERIELLEGQSRLRMWGDRPYRTNQGNMILDCTFDMMPDLTELALDLQAIPGALGHGLFLTEIDALYVATGGIVTKMERPAS